MIARHRIDEAAEATFPSIPSMARFNAPRWFGPSPYNGMTAVPVFPGTDTMTLMETSCL
jgi:hypothetical protein